MTIKKTTWLKVKVKWVSDNSIGKVFCLKGNHHEMNAIDWNAIILITHTPQQQQQQQQQKES